MRRTGGRDARIDGEAAVAAEPGDGAFDGPAVAAEPLRGLDADAGDAVADVRARDGGTGPECSALHWAGSDTRV
jgi:hypothetical protein